MKVLEVYDATLSFKYLMLTQRVSGFRSITKEHTDELSQICYTKKQEVSCLTETEQSILYPVHLLSKIPSCTPLKHCLKTIFHSWHIHTSHVNKLQSKQINSSQQFHLMINNKWRWATFSEMVVKQQSGINTTNIILTMIIFWGVGG